MNPLLGVFYHWLGGVAAGSFYVPFRGVRSWSWETSWLVAGVFSWIIAPWFFATLNTTDPLRVLMETPASVLIPVFLFGVAWGFGGLTFGLAIRYLGMSLGMAVALGYCTVFGTLIPPLINGNFSEKLIESASGRWVLGGLGVCVAGIVVTALAGRAKERETKGSAKPATTGEFNLRRGILVASFSGIMSACFAFGLNAGDPMRVMTYKVDLANSAAAAGAPVDISGEPYATEIASVLSAVEAAWLFEETPGFGELMDAVEIEASAADSPASGTASAIKATVASLQSPLAARLIAYSANFGKLGDSDDIEILRGLGSLGEKETALRIAAGGGNLRAIHSKHHLWTGLPVLIVVLAGGFATNFIWCVMLNFRNRSGGEYVARSVPLVRNYVFAALAGVIWYFQFFFYSMGETQMGEYKFSSWTLHMASIIIFSSIWGLALKEWKGAGTKAKGLLFAGLAILVLSTMVVGYGTYLESGDSAAEGGSH